MAAALIETAYILLNVAWWIIIVQGDPELADRVQCDQHQQWT